ncbi:MAG: hypothetical protein JWP89_3078 [Schlesneria sp.]|nr:hypothetical protein [Schlesneria sp.]
MPVIQVSSSYGDALWGRVASEGSKLRTAEAAVGRGARESCQFRSFRPTDPWKQLAFGQDYRQTNPARCAISGHSRRCQGRFRGSTQLPVIQMPEPALLMARSVEQV